MKKIKPGYVVCFLFLFIIFFFMISIFIRFIGMNFFNYDFGQSNKSEVDITQTDENSFDWLAEYPIGDDGLFINETNKNSQSESINTQTNFSAFVKNFEEKIDYYATKLLFGRMKFVEGNALFNKSIGMKIVTGTDSVVVMNNGYLTFQSEESDTDYCANGLKWFNEKLKSKGINLLYVQFPGKEKSNDNVLPAGCTDYNNINADNLLKSVKNSGVNYVDFRPLLSEKSKDWYSNFFKTDHHWKPETGVWAAGEIAKTLNRLYDYGIDESIGNIDKYNIRVYEDYCFGSQGKIATLGFAKPEDISVISPLKETNFTVKYENNESMTGKLEDVLIDKRVFEKIDYYGISVYGAYLYGNNAVVSIRNNNVKNGKKIVVIADSFLHCLVPYLAQSVESIYVIDLRYFNGSTMTYINSVNPDTVIVAYNPSLINQTMFTFH